MVHGDDKGLVLPPRATGIKAVVIPIMFGKENSDVIGEAHSIAGQLDGSIVDDRSEYTAGWKFNEWEMKGIPLRIEIGPKDIAAKQVVFVRRDNGKKETVPMKDLKKQYDKTLDEIQKNLFEKAKKFLHEHTREAKNWNELENLIFDGNIVLVDFCGSDSCEKKVKEATTATPRVIASEKKGKCAICNRPSAMQVYFAKAY